MKYAYLIIANRNHQQLQKLITALDDSRNDIYLIIDKKSKNFQKKFNVDYSNIYYLKPINIYWGNYSQIQAELNLFKAAAPEHYTYYHLLSGLDLPLVNQDKIHEFFDNNLHHEFITYGNPNNLYTLPNRIKRHHFINYFRNPNLFIKIYRRIENMFIGKRYQPVSLNKLDYGSQWVSLDDDLVHLILNCASIIHYIYQYGTLVDEVFIPTLLNYYPKYKDRIYYRKRVTNKPNEFQGNLRYINWWDGNPYTWRMKDYDTLKKACKMGHLFSRKFDSLIDNDIIKKIFHDIMR